MNRMNGGNGAGAVAAPAEASQHAGAGEPGARAHADAAGQAGMLVPEAGTDFVVTKQVQKIADRAAAYLEAGYPVHFSGPAGTGKTTLALHVASRLGRSVTLLHGDDEFGSSDLVGGDFGFRKSRLVDNYVRSVMKTEETATTLWVDNRLTAACRRGDTLVYDEFTRSRAEANNVLLSVLAEGILTFPKLRVHGEDYLDVHPRFRAIFTSNPEEYAGVHGTQDALMDRLVTIQLGHFDRETEVRIAAAKSGIARAEAQAIVDLVRTVRAQGAAKGGRHPPSLRASIVIARVLVRRGARVRPDDPFFRTVCGDVLGLTSGGLTRALGASKGRGGR